MEQLYVFGTGNAAVTRCYNTCFAVRDEDRFFMVDAGGGNGILRILNEMNVPLDAIHHIFVTHEHSDHILGIVWMVRMIGSRILAGKYEGNLHIYCHDQLTDTIAALCRLTLQGKICRLFGDRILLVPVTDGQTERILDYDVTFFDIHSTKARQFGFTMTLKNGKKFTCAGDEPYNPVCRPYVEGSGWLLHEAFCLYGDREKYKPYEKHHSTVKDACELADELHIPNLVLWHTEDDHLDSRRETYTAEGRQYYSGNLYVPDDKEILDL
ncbi:MAG TPA: MBL fold metallo-hydrolase [Candidatus Lachnoclostridium pullistercoris]|uniref:MBL fold metallo-hydrolase n=1 Tax=Candidatus Lachnoclostridium pullistercoris TaxID=2838632 RepID=A0A9D2PGW2_9FIRM|nr:MBL fold metallo-hydrolase [Candidatus Lachnoclostridium pullistercoris]